MNVRIKKKENQNNVNDRLFNIDLLKIICCISVIIIHVSANYINDIKNYKNEMFYINLLNSITRFAVPCFIMISGYFAISNRKKDNYITFYKKKVKTIIIPMIIFTLIYLIIAIFNIVLGNSERTFKSLFVTLITGELEYHMWYLYMIIPIYIITPLLWNIKNKIGERGFDKLGKILIIISMPFALTSTHTFSYDIGFSIYYIGYYILGYSIAQKINNKSNTKFCIYLFWSLILLFLNSFFRLYILNSGFNDNTYELPFIGNFTPMNELWILIVISSICLYKAFLYIDLKINLYCISKYTLYIYMVHVIILSFLRTLHLEITPYILIPIYTLATFALSILLSKIYLIIYSKIDKNSIIEKKLYRYMDKYLISQSKNDKNN